MPTAEQQAIEGQKEILVAQDDFALALQNLGKAQSNNLPVNEYQEKLSEAISTGNRFYNSVENCILRSELLGAYRSEFWAADLANTALNCLETIPDYWDVIRQEAKACNLDPNNYKPGRRAYSAMQTAVAIYNPDQAKSLQEQFDTANLPTWGFTHPYKVNSRYDIWEKIAMMAIVVVFLLIMLAIGIWVQQPTDLGIFIFRTVLSLLAGAFGAIFIPGLFEVQGTLGKWTIRAAGAAAFFVVVYLLNPPALVKNQPQPRDHSSTNLAEQVQFG